MNAIILAGGSGERLRPYTEDLPKGMLAFDGKTLIERQVDLYRTNGISDITVATGYRAEKIKYSGIHYTHNPDYSSTNMVETLLSARSALRGDTLVSYADVVFEERVLQYVLKDRSDIGVLVDTAWKDYWIMRYGDTHTDIEGLKLDEKGRVTEIGKPEDSDDEIDGRYVGLIKFSPRGAERFLSVYDQAKAQFWNKPWQTSRTFQRAYMTDMLQALVDDGVDVRAIKIEHGWLEFDTVNDYEDIVRRKESGNLGSIFKP